MSVKQLKADLAETLASVNAMDPATTTTADLVRHLKLTLYPTLESLAEEIGELDECVIDLIEGVDDVLSTETSAVFAGIITGGAVLIAELEKRAAGDAAIAKMITEWRALAAEGTSVLQEITIDLSDVDDADDEDDEGDDEDEDGDADDDDADEEADSEH